MSEYFGLHFHLIVSDTMLEYIPFGGIGRSAGERKVKERKLDRKDEMPTK